MWDCFAFTGFFPFILELLTSPFTLLPSPVPQQTHLHPSPLLTQLSLLLFLLLCLDVTLLFLSLPPPPQKKIKKHTEEFPMRKCTFKIPMTETVKFYDFCWFFVSIQQPILQIGKKPTNLILKKGKHIVRG